MSPIEELGETMSQLMEADGRELEARGIELERCLAEVMAPCTADATPDGPSWLRRAFRVLKGENDES